MNELRFDEDEVEFVDNFISNNPLFGRSFDGHGTMMETNVSTDCSELRIKGDTIGSA